MVDLKAVEYIQILGDSELIDRLIEEKLIIARNGELWAPIWLAAILIVREQAKLAKPIANLSIIRDMVVIKTSLPAELLTLIKCLAETVDDEELRRQLLQIYETKKRNYAQQIIGKIGSDKLSPLDKKLADKIMKTIDEFLNDS